MMNIELHTIKGVVMNNIVGTEIKESLIHGFGLFATKELRVNNTLCKLSGQRLSPKEYQELIDGNLENTSNREAMAYNFLMECNYATNRVDLIVRALRTKYSYINHSTEPNVFFDLDCQEVYPLRNILPGEELLIDYRNEPLPDIFYQKNADWLSGSI